MTLIFGIFSVVPIFTAGGGDSIFKVHRERVPSIGRQREGSFFNPPSLINWETFFDLYEKTFEIFSASPSTT